MKTTADRLTPKPHVIDFRYAPNKACWACLGRPDDSLKTLVREDGALLYGFNREWWRPSPLFFRRVIEFGLQTDRSPVGMDQHTESARSAIMVTTLRYPKATLTLRAFGHQHDGDRRTDVVLWSLKLEPGVREFLSGLWMTVQEPGWCFTPRAYPKSGQEIVMVRAQDGPLPVDYNQPGEIPVDHPAAAGQLAFLSVPHKLRPYQAFGFAPVSGLASDLMLLRDDERVEGAVAIPLNHHEVAGMDWAWMQQASAAERRFWADTPLQTLAIDVPDPDVSAMLDASARNILQAREIKAGIPEFQVGPTFYRGLWVADGHFFLEAARYLGWSQPANQGIDALLRRVKPDGAITQMPFHHKETAISLATLVRQTELSGDWDRLRSLWPTVRNAVRYIQQLRREARELPASSPAHGLMPPSFGDGGLCGCRPEYTTTLWTLIGLKHTAQAARWLQFNEDAALVQEEFDRLLADFRTRAERDMRTLPDGLPYLPMCMPGGSSENLLDPDFKGEVPIWERLTPATGTWALCHAIYPGEVFTPEDPIVTNLLELFTRIDKEEEIPANTGAFSYQAVWPYYASFAAHAWLYAGRPEKAVDYLYGFANHAAPTRVWREEQYFRDSHFAGSIGGDMPHNWASAEFVRLVRNLLVFERGSELELLRGLPAEWVAAGKGARVERTPTRFGPVSVALTLDEWGGGRIVVERDVAWAIQPRAVRLHLPPHVDRQSVQFHKSPWSVDEHQSVLLPAEPRTVMEFRLAHSNPSATV